MYSRRDVWKLGLAATPLARLQAKPESVVKGVIIGAQSYSFRDRSLDEMIKAMNDIGLSYCELWQGHVEPRKASREELRKWRLETPLAEFENVRRKFDKAGVKLFAYSYGFRADLSDEEIARGFDMARALGVDVITSSANVSVAGRVDRYASKAKMMVGMHNHSNLRPDEFSRPEDFEEAMRGRSKYMGVNLDIGHFLAAGYDPVDYIQKHHDRIVGIHLKDRKKNQGDNLPFGQGETPIREALQLIARNKYKIPAMIEYEYKGADTVEEVRKSYEYCRRAL